eukprot:TRINITY_DN9183_c0_g1_i1.p1 TRINITY_DN9183_c0_g1~~TRINITY_DN9183_c0_g1_i1.p1  ORF type:complete len:356 (-),score=55.81 TRINITY_DN9183_c0_g1_i1:113-1180(-)
MLIPTKWHGLMVAVGYGVCSTSITLFNKAVLSYYKFPYSNTLTCLQMVLSITFLWSADALGFITLPPLNLGVAKKIAPLSIFFGLMVMSGLAPLAYVNVPMYGALRRFVTFIVIVGERVILGREIENRETYAVYMMVIGAIIASAGDIGFTLVGYLLITFNCFVTALYLVYIKKKSVETGLNTFGLLLYNSLIALPMVVVTMLYYELDAVMAYPQWTNPGFLFCLMMSGVLAFFLNYLIFLCSTVNSPLTTSITGQLKALVQTIAGLFLFGDVEVTRLLALGLGVSSTASIWYAQIKLNQRSKAQDESLKMAGTAGGASIEKGKGDGGKNGGGGDVTLISSAKSPRGSPKGSYVV